MERPGVSREREAALQRDWTKGSIIGNLVSLAWPMIVGGSLDMLGPTIDMVWMGRLGIAAIASVGVSGIVVNLANSMAMGLYTGLRAMVARFVGAGDTRGANHAAQQAIVISIAYSIIMAVIGILFAEPILVIFGVAPDVVSQGAPYLRINFVGMVTMSFRNMTQSTMQASGDSRTPMWIAVFYRLSHIALCPFFVFGWWLFPRMEASGAAMTSVFTQGLGAAIGLWFLFSGRTRLRLTLRNFSIDPNIIWRLVKISLPASVSSMERTLGNLALMWFITPFGTLAVAAHSVLQRVEGFLWAPSQALGQGAGVLAGQNLGARQPERAERTGWLAASFLSGVMLITLLSTFLWADMIIHIFSSAPDLVELGTAFLRIACAGFLAMAVGAVFQQCINTAGDTLVSMLVMLLNMWLIQVPLAFYLPRITGLGVLGVRWAIVGGQVTSTIAYTIYFGLGRWKRKKV